MENKTNFKDVAHLYSGVLMKTQMGVFPLITLYNGSWMLDTIAYGANAVEDDIKPILRPLSDMTQEDADALGFKAFGVLRDSLGAPTLPQRHVSIRWAARNTAYLLSKHFDLFGLIESGQAINATTLTPNPYTP